MSDDIFLGLDLAVARVAEELQTVTAMGPSPLRDVAYPAKANVLWRWVDAQEDAAVWTFVRAYMGIADGARVRSSLTMEDFYTLMTFARRCVLAALRNEDPGAAEAAFDALSAIDIARVDWRDIVFAASLASFAARRVGLGPDEVLAGAVIRADPRVADILEQAAIKQVDIAGDWGYREVRTSDGPVLVESDGDESVALLVQALAVVDLIEEDGRYEVSGAGQVAELPAVWLSDSPATAEARRRLRDCVSVNAEPPESRFRHFLVVFLAEAADERDAELIASAASGRGDDATVQLGIACGTRCAVVVARSGVMAESSIEDSGSLARFAEPIRALLSQA